VGETLSLSAKNEVAAPRQSCPGLMQQPRDPGEDVAKRLHQPTDDHGEHHDATERHGCPVPDAPVRLPLVDKNREALRGASLFFSC
jgi:hypothetical protein